MKKIAIITPLIMALALNASAGVRPINPKTGMPETAVHYYIAYGITTRSQVQGWHEYYRTVYYGPWRSKAACEKWANDEARKADNRSWQCEPVYSPNAPRKAEGGK